MSRTVFTADLHLSDDTPALNRLFFEALNQWRGRVDALYILGDLFEVWLGDDVLSETAVQTASALKAFSETAPVYFICGNRDFLLGRRYARQAGMTLLPEVQRLGLYGKNYLISHGDELCTDDAAYQRFRRIMRQKWLQRIFLSLPQQFRSNTAEKIRNKSKAVQSEMGQSSISDVTEAAVQTALSHYPDTDAVIHGHTHRPAVHHHDFQGKTVARYVIPDWYGAHGGYVEVSPQGAEIKMLGDAV